MELRQHVVFALRESGKRYWRIKAFQGEKEQFFKSVERQLLPGSEFRVIDECSFAVGSDNYVTRRAARKDGWSNVPGTSEWVPMDEPYPLEATGPAYQSLSFKIDYILYGSIVLSMTVDGEVFDITIDDVDDSLIELVKFTRLLRERREPHGYLADNNSTWFGIRNVEGGQLCFIRFESWKEEPREISVYAREGQVSRAFSELTRELAAHPFLQHMWLCFGIGMRDADYDSVAEAANVEWRELVKQGLVEDDWHSMQMHEAKAVVERVPLIPESEAWSQEVVDMLRSLEIPQKWKS